jgi:hypothetical protein
MRHNHFFKACLFILFVHSAFPSAPLNPAAAEATRRKCHGRTRLHKRKLVCPGRHDD